MTTTDTKPAANGEHLIEQRLDALDRALLGMLPRSERLVVVAQVETRVRELIGSNSAVLSSLEMAVEPEIVTGAVSRREATVAPKRRSRLALSSGILGIFALVMLFAMPITYLFVATLGEGLGELVTISLLSVHVLAVAVGGLVAIVMGISGLVSLSRRKGRVGHGWAITGLCTAPLPAFIGGLLVLATSLSLGSASVDSTTVPSPVMSTSYSSPATYGAPSTGSPYAPAMATPINQPLPLSAAPTFCKPGAECPPSGSYQTPGEFPALSIPTLPSAPAAPIAPATSNSAPPVSLPAPDSAAPSSLRY